MLTLRTNPVRSRTCTSLAVVRPLWYRHESFGSASRLSLIPWVPPSKVVAEAIEREAKFFINCRESYVLSWLRIGVECINECDDMVDHNLSFSVQGEHHHPD